MSELIETQEWQLSVEGMHCARCIRKIQEASEQFSDLQDLKVDFSRNSVKVKTTKGFDLDPFVNSIKDLGFQVRLLPNEEKGQDEHSSVRSQLSRIGVVGACTGNIMLLSVAIYSGADLSEFSELFPWLIFSFFIPVVTFGAWPIFKNCFFAFRQRKVSIDTPIALAIAGGSVISFINLLEKSDQLYFDSIAMFVFFILSSRYMVMRLQEKYMNPVAVSDLFSQKNVVVIRGDQELEIPSSQVQEEDLLQVRAGDYVQVDGQVFSSFAEIDNSFFSGECLPLGVKKWDVVHAGARALNDFQLKATADQKNSRLQSLVESLNKSLLRRTPLTSLTDRGAHWLTVVVVLISLVYLALSLSLGWADGINRLLALLVVACPCALAIASPLALSLSVRNGLKNSILFKDPSALEKLNDCRAVVFDKTGTLTGGLIEVTHWEPQIPSSLDQAIIYQMEKKSQHPIARAILRSLQDGADLVVELSAVQEVPGQGVRATYEGDDYRLGQIRGESHKVGFYKNDILVSTALLTDLVNEASPEVIWQLSQEQKDLYLLSGDVHPITQAIGARLGFDAKNIHGQMSPEEKSQFVEEIGQKEKTLFIGDGINDALAMSRSSVSVSTHSAAETTFKVSSIHLLNQNLKNIPFLFHLSREYVSTIKLNVAISFVYNLTFATLALMGYINPLIAVILMPLSSLGVTGLTLYRINRVKP